ncbi:accessory factor UbiK family protein [Allohahella marinimesophila]|uniref:Ubiquinone biosynthesis accessory factor UbiK n=1 Tax=Allohahella marinimesophila TaxID=1054972 RepID=A0ABP7PD18_9GAMM
MKSPVDLLQGFHENFGQYVPGLAKSAQQDAQMQLKAAVSSILDKLDVVSREEFEAQKAVLIRTRERLATLEKRLDQVEGKLVSQ